jgi:hypothetical protein
VSPRDNQAERKTLEELRDAKAIVARHQDGGGLCKCCAQPWPCDLARVFTLMNKWANQ